MFPSNVFSSGKSQYDAKFLLLKRIIFNSSKLLRGINKGEYNSLFRNVGLDYMESTLYSYGDDARHIDWKVSARMSALYTKRFIDDTNRLVWILFDCSGSMNIGAPSSLYEVGMEVVLTLARLSLLEKNEIGGVLFTNQVVDYLRPSKVYSILDIFLHTLLQNQYKKEKSNLEEAISFSRNILSRRALIIICSDFLAPDFREQIQQLAKIHDILLVRTKYNAKKMLSSNGFLKVSDTEHDKQGVISLSQIRNTLSVEQLVADRKWNLFCERNNIPFLNIETTDNVFVKLLYLFKKSNK